MTRVSETHLSTVRRLRPHAAWRHALLDSAGLPEELSRAVAASDAHDLDRLLGLLQRGCPAATALRISAHEDRMPAA